MIIPRQIMAKWKKLWRRGDYQLMAAKTNSQTASESFRQAFYKGECSDQMFVQIGAFYKSVEKERTPAVKMKGKLLKELA